MFSPDNIENEFFLKLGFSFSADQLSNGKVLVSEPFLGDPHFNRSVILLASYNKEDGAMGLVINKPTELYMKDMIEGFPHQRFPFHYGGPVNPETLFFVHTLGEAISGAVPISDGLYLNGDFEVLTGKIIAGEIKEENVKFFGGYSGWSPGQLEGELEGRSWILCDLAAQDIMLGEADEMWRKSLRSLGKKFSIMADFPEDPGMN